MSDETRVDDWGNYYILDEEAGDWVDCDGISLAESMWVRMGRELPIGPWHVGWKDQDVYNTVPDNLTLLPD